MCACSLLTGEQQPATTQRERECVCVVIVCMCVCVCKYVSMAPRACVIA